MTFKIGDKVKFIGRPPNTHFSEDYRYIEGKVYTVKMIDGRGGLESDLNTVENHLWMDVGAFRKFSICKSDCCKEGDRSCPFFQESR